MAPIHKVSQVFDAIREAKASAPAFCTNFFPVERKVQGWIDHGELEGEAREGTAFFLRKDRDFKHLYFCAPSAKALSGGLALLPELRKEPMAVDLVGTEAALEELLAVFEGAGFKRYSRLQRMARSHEAVLPQTDGVEAAVECAAPGDCQAIVNLLDASFDRYADQIPMPHEVETAIANRQMLAVKSGDALAAVLFFETQGMTSTIRYWAVAEAFRSRRFGSALMRSYLQAHKAVKRFILWVVTANRRAVERYRHYGYSEDDLIDHVLANEFIIA